MIAPRTRRTGGLPAGLLQAARPFSSSDVDPLTHVLLGANAGFALFGRKLGRSAALAGGMAAFVPDADIFIRSTTDPLLAVEYHRHFTHALVFAPVGAAAVAALWLLRAGCRDRGRWLTLWSCCTVGYLTHPLLDASTTYGTQLLWPFSRTRFGWDLVSVIDPAMTLVLLAGLVVALVTTYARASIMSLALGLAYLAAGAVQHTRAVAAQQELAAQRGHVIERHEVMPTFANNIVWRAIYIHDGRIYSDRIRAGWFSGVTIREGWSLPLVRESDLTAAEERRNQRRSFQRFAWFSEQWVARSPSDPALLGDMRYSLSGGAFDPIWGIRFTAPDAPIEVEWVNRTRDRRIDPRELWHELRGHDPQFKSMRGQRELRSR